MSGKMEQHPLPTRKGISRRADPRDALAAPPTTNQALCRQNASADVDWSLRNLRLSLQILFKTVLHLLMTGRV